MAAQFRIVGCIVVLGCAPAPLWAQTFAMSEQTVAAGVAATHTEGVGAIAFMGGGTVADFDADGFQDVFMLGGGLAPDRLFLNNRDGTFSDQAVAAGLASSHVGSGAAAADYDHDGLIDLFVTSFGAGAGPAGPGHHRLYRNNGDGTFTDVAAAAGVSFASPDRADGMSAAFGDYDLDGDLDLAVAGFFTGSGGNRLFRNNGDGTFSDVTSTAILFEINGRSGYDGFCRGFAPRFVDMDGDRYPEILWVADVRTTRYFVNNADGTFSEYTQPAGVGREFNGMGQAVGDFDNDGDLDWYVTSIFLQNNPMMPGNMLYLNQGNHSYVEVSAPAGVKEGAWGWGTVAVDLDHDGRCDLVETNGWHEFFGRFLNEPMRVYMNTGIVAGLPVFEDRAAAVGVDHTGQGRGLSNFDYDNDGDQDLVVFSRGEPLTLYRNDLAGPGTSWLRIFLDIGARENLAPHGIGARVRATAGGLTQVRPIDAGSNYLSQSEISAHFGLGAETVVSELRIEWPDGQVSTLRDVAANQTLTVTAPANPRLAGDVDIDGDVDLLDLATLLSAFGACLGQAGYTLASDLDGDDCVDLPDLFTLLESFGQTR